MDSTVHRVLRIARIDQVNLQDGTCQLSYLDRFDERPVLAPLPHPYAANGAGIYAVPKLGTMALVGFGYRNQPFVITLLNPNGFVRPVDSKATANYLETDFLPVPNLLPGETLHKGSDRTYLKLAQDGNLIVNFGFSNITYDSDDFIVTKTGNTYTSSSATQASIGEIRRDLGETADTLYGLIDRRISPDYEATLSTISRNPDQTPRSKTGNLTGGAVGRRNPPLVENRELVFEYSRDYGVLSPGTEQGLFEQSAPTDFKLQDFSRREATRTNVLGLDPGSYNNLAERILGTVVDVYGSVLDINRKKIDFSPTQQLDPAQQLSQQLALLKRSVKYHFELNSRKDGDIPSPDDMSGDDFAIGPKHSRWSIDVDGEGLTKINIPASTNVGNICLPARYVSSALKHNDYSYQFRDPDQRDQYHLSYSQVEGLEIKGTYAPDTISGSLISAGSIYHSADFSDILERRTFFPGGFDDYQTRWVESVTTTTSLDNRFGSKTANVGGRSVHMNLDGSLELCVGRDVADHKSILLDTSGSAQVRLGSDYKGNSLNVGADGSVNIVVGASKNTGETITGAKSFKLLIESNGAVATIEIDDGNIFIRSAPGKNLVIESANNLVLSSKGATILHGETIGMYGSFDEEGNGIAPERILQRNGRVID